MNCCGIGCLTLLACDVDDCPAEALWVELSPKLRENLTRKAKSPLAGGLVVNCGKHLFKCPEMTRVLSDDVWVRVECHHIKLGPLDSPFDDFLKDATVKI